MHEHPTGEQAPHHRRLDRLAAIAFVRPGRQAIARFARSVMDRVGAEGSRKVVLIWGDPDRGGEAMEADWGIDTKPGEHKGLALSSKMVGKNIWAATLLAEKVEVGTFFDYETNPPNPFEACIKMTAGGKTMYYAAGVADGARQTPMEVLNVFWGLVWYMLRSLNPTDRQARLGTTPPGYFVMDVVRVYRKTNAHRDHR